MTANVTSETRSNADAADAPQPARATRRKKKVDDASEGLKAGPVWAFIAWALTILFFLPVFWMVLTSFHSETDAATNPPSFTAPLTVQGYREFFGSDPWPSLLNSVTASVLSTLLVLALAIPAAYALSIRPVEKWTDVMFFFLSTRMLPAVAGLLPMLLFCVAFLLADQAGTLVDEAVRALVGPREGTTVIYLSPILAILGEVTRNVVVVCLLAAALGRVVAGLREREELVVEEPAGAAEGQEPVGSGQSA